MANPHKRLKHPYYLKQLYTSWRFRVLKHEHTLKRVHHQHTSYPLLALLLLVIAVILGQCTFSTFAASHVISSVVSGPPPTVAATIETPTENADITSLPITVAGSCPLDSYVQLFRNNYPSGTSYCSSSGTYSITSDLFPGTNGLIVRDYNLAGTAGPDSLIRTVTYTPPVPTFTPPIQSSSQEQPSPSSQTKIDVPLTIKNDYLFQGFFVGSEASWKVAIAGGTNPYAVRVDWGDNTSALYTSEKADTLLLTHVFNKAGPENGGYAIKVNVTDSSNHTATLQIFALVSDIAGTQTATSTTNHPQQNSQDVVGGLLGMTGAQALGVAWTGLGTTGVGLLGFWLGEIRQLRLIRSGFRLITKH